MGGAGVQGTAVAKYEPAKATDTLNKNGVTVSVHTLLHCITASNSYMQKSMEVSPTICHSHFLIPRHMTGTPL